VRLGQYFEVQDNASILTEVMIMKINMIPKKASITDIRRSMD